MWGNKDLDTVGGDIIWLYSSKYTLSLHCDNIKFTFRNLPHGYACTCMPHVLNDDICL